MLNHCVKTYDPTMEDLYRKKVVIDRETCCVEILDTTSQEEYTALRELWVREGEGFVLVYSIGSRPSFIRIQMFHDLVYRVKWVSSAFSAPCTELLPMMLVGHNCERTTEREVSTQEGHALAREFGCDFLEASAKNCINFEKTFYDVVRMIRKQRIRAATQ